MSRQVRELLPAEARGPLSRNLQSLVAKGLVQRGPPGSISAQEYSFRHILIQEAAYRAIPKSLRAELHHRFADWLEAVVSDPFPGRSEILGYHLERSVRYRNELRPADPQSAALSLRAAAHLDTAGCAAHDRGDDVAAVNLLDRAAALLPGDDPALGRLYTNLGTALIEATQFDKARATLDHAQHITAANGDECQHAHARVESLLLSLRVNPSEAAIDITRALPGLRSDFAGLPTTGGSARPCSSRARFTGTTPDRLPPNTRGSAPLTMPGRRTTGGNWPISSAGSPRPHSGARHPRRKGSGAVRTTSTRSGTIPSAGARSC